MGVKEYLIIVNKMDQVKFEKSRFDFIQKEMSALIKKLGMNLVRV